ncbi:FGGY-family carbohydrate kinase [Nigerium massiliense]|uniref:FGGY-family carbohydrate kinase n=1 Tax=Nigerium massiliense TaxID=1522317 RepID=UPI0006932B75|nr:FGGY family carbohydrate kinase [Nigerium massiliense]
MSDVFMGIDLGTGGARVGLFDEAGTPIAFRDSTVRSSYPRQGWMEQDADEWWSALRSSVHDVLASSGVAPSDIVGIGYDAHSASLVAVDADAKPLRPGIMWADVRAAEQAARAGEIDHWARLYNGGGEDAVSAEWFIYKALWVKENEPDVWAKARWVLDAPDWIGLKLTGEAATNITSASLKMHHNNDHGGWPTDFYAQLGLDDLLTKVPETVNPLGERLGTLTAEAAEELGLAEGTPVAQGTIDAEAGMIGMNVLEPGKMALITGSSNCLLAQAADPLFGPGLVGSHTDAVLPGQYTVEASQSSTGSVVRWFLETYARDLVDAEAAGGASAYDVLNEESRDIPPGSDGVLVTEYFQGNRSPYVDAKARGTITGLSLHHTRAHLYHAVQEATCHGLELNLRTLRGLGYETKQLVACGGALSSPAWMQMHADVTGMDITITQVQDGPTLGSAILGAVASGRFASIPDAAAAMVHQKAVVSPDPQRHEEYTFWTEQYAAIHPAVRGIQHAVSDHLSRQGRSAAQPPKEHQS